MRLTLDTSCVLNLLRTEEEVDESLLRLLRLGFAGRVTIAVTHVVKSEVPTTATSYIRERLEAFPVLEVSLERTREHVELAALPVRPDMRLRGGMSPATPAASSVRRAAREVPAPRSTSSAATSMPPRAA